jgi:hypothetical protein
MRRLGCSLVAFLVGMIAWAGATGAEEIDEATFARQRLLLEVPDARLLNEGSRLTRVFGQPLAYGVEPVDTAERFRASHVEIFGVLPADLQPHSLLADQRHTQPIKFDPATGQYQFTLVYYTQYSSDIEVFRSDLRLLVRNEPGHPLVLAASALRPLGEFAVDDNLRADVADADFVRAAFEAGKEEAVGRFPTLANFTEPRVVIWAGVDDMEVEPKVALTFIADDAPAPRRPAEEKWLFVTDVETGEILYQEDQILEIDVNGSVSGLATELSGAEQCEDEVPTALPYARVNIGGTIAFADEFGDFLIPNGGSSDVTVVSGVRGQFFRVFHEPTGGETTLSQVVTPPGPADFLHNDTNIEFRRAEVNAYLGANAVRDYVLSYIPDYPVIAGQTEYSITVNEAPDGFCPGNAQYQGDNLRFCAAGGGQPNTAWSSVVYHEYGHHLIASGGSGQGPYGEGMSDVTSMLVLDESGTGYGFFGGATCNTPLRDADNNCLFLAAGCSTCGSANHSCGQLISGCFWSTREELVLTNPLTYRDILTDLALNSIMLHSGSSITPSIAVDLLTLDDDDANINNGTPHAPEICTGFGAHDMPCPLEDLSFAYPSGQPAIVAPNQTSTLEVNVFGITDTPIPGTGMISYRIGTSGSFTTVAMNEISANEYEATLPAADCPETIQYYVSVSAVGGIVTDPASAPLALYSTVAASGVVPQVSYNFESNPGWTVSSTVTDGAWDSGPQVPVAGCDRGNPPTDFDGSGQCWMTDNSAASACNSDVDNGMTVLTSEVFDLSGMAAPHVTYARWYDNSAGDGAEQDIFVVQISINGGSSWTSLEVVGPTGTNLNPEVHGGWFVKNYAVPASAQFQIRFTAQDTNPQSVVEAAIDAFKILDYECVEQGNGDFDSDGDVDMLDYRQFENCFDQGTVTPACEPGDMTGNDLIGLDDFKLFFEVRTSPN